MHQKILDQLANRRFIVQILPDGSITAGALSAMPLDALNSAVCDELTAALGDALQGDALGGRCWDDDDDEERPLLRVVTGYALERGRV